MLFPAEPLHHIEHMLRKPDPIGILHIDNLSAQSPVLDRVLDQSVALHVKWFAHMTNLALVNATANAYFTHIMEALIQAKGFAACGRP
jgi:hypothetical protein